MVYLTIGADYALLMDTPARNIVFARPVFMVDDELEDRAEFARLLKRAEEEYEPQLFARGEDLIDALLRVLRGAPSPLACFVDVKMAGMSGFDVLRWIRCQQSLSDIPVIMLSSTDDPDKLAEAKRIGAQCYIAKFPSALQLREIVREAERFSEKHGTAPFQLTYNLLMEAGALAHAVGSGK
jgi:CheY-like chemotaxis protein